MKPRDVSMLPKNYQLPLRFYVYGDTVLFIEESGGDFRSLEVADPRIAKKMKGIFERFFRKTEVSKKGGVGREVDLYLIRHGETVSQEKSSRLSPKGRLQAEVEALCLLLDIWSQGGGLLKFYNSPTPRAQETSDIMLAKAQKIIGSSEHSPIKLYNPQVAASLEAAGIIGPLMKMGISYEKIIEYWLTNPEAVEGKAPRVIYERLQKFLRRGQKLADRLPGGKKIHYVGVTHEAPQAALLNQINGKTLNELGGKIQNCESIKIEFRGDSDENPSISFRDRTMRIGKPDDSGDERE